nr:hypothetical protein DKQYCJNZ_DKQYCJNZ_CDS_0004 [Microvirus sp.]
MLGFIGDDNSWFVVTPYRHAPSRGLSLVTKKTTHTRARTRAKRTRACARARLLY